MSGCQVNDCGIDMKEILTTLDNGNERITCCPNHMAMLGIDVFENEGVKAQSSERTDHHKCECCYDEHTIEYKDKEATFYLCKNHLTNLIDLNLSPKDFFTLYSRVGDVYILHDDFYHPETGEAFQPRERE